MTRRLRYNVAASLDGFIADRNGGFDWILHDPTVDFGAIFASVDTVMVGRQVDAIEVTLVPVLLGEGVPLLAAGSTRIALALEQTKVYPTGMIALHYSVPGNA